MEEPSNVRKKRSRRHRSRKKSKNKALEVDQESARTLLDLKRQDEEPASPPLSFSELDYISFDTPPDFFNLHQSINRSDQQILTPSAENFSPSPLPEVIREEPTQNGERRSRKKRKKPVVDDSLVDPVLIKGMDAVKAFVDYQEPAPTTISIENRVRPVVDLDDDFIRAEMEDSVVEEDDDCVSNSFELIPLYEEPPSKKQCIKRRPRPPTQAAGKPLPSEGTFTAEELAAIDNHFVQYREMHNPPLTHEELCKRVWANNRAKDSFWESVCHVLPNRSKASVYKHVRRTYHLYESRGVWTQEEDDTLRNLFEEKGSAWKEIGEELERMPEDCRDRWRNYVKCGDRRGQNAWTPEEEKKLRSAIYTCLGEVLKKRDQEGGNVRQGESEEQLHRRVDEQMSELQEKINWTVVSDKIDNWRSRIQCRYKWNKMLEEPSSNSTRSPVVIKKQDLLVGDQIWLLYQLSSSKYRSFEDVNWEKLAISDPQNTWFPNDLKTAYTRLKSGVRNQKRMTLQEIAKQLLTDLESLPSNLRHQRTEGKRHPAHRIQADPSTPRKSRGRPRSKKKQRKILSAAFVTAEDDLKEEEDDVNRVMNNHTKDFVDLGATAKAAIKYVDKGDYLELDSDAV